MFARLINKRTGLNKKSLFMVSTQYFRNIRSITLAMLLLVCESKQPIYLNEKVIYFDDVKDPTFSIKCCCVFCLSCSMTVWQSYCGSINVISKIRFFPPHLLSGLHTYILYIFKASLHFYPLNTRLVFYYCCRENWSYL